MSGRSLVVIGDALLDRDLVGRAERLCPDAPVPVIDGCETLDRPGGAALAALLARRLGASVTLVTALGHDDAGRHVANLLEAAGVDVVAAPLGGATPEKIRVRAGGQSLLRIDRGGEGAPIGHLPARAASAASGAGAVLVSDYGRGMTRLPAVRALTAAANVPVVWDPHPRGAAPTDGAAVVTPNRSELLAAFPPPAGGSDLVAVTAAGRAARRRWGARSVAVTLGAGGALVVYGDGAPLAVPARPASGDPCGAGDCFAAATAVAIAGGAVVSEAAVAAVEAAGAFVAAGGVASVAGPAAGPDRSVPAAATAGYTGGAAQLAAEVRASGGTVVVAGGCFDLLHAGHVALLEAARRLGDCLIVALNSDESVRRLKGPRRPVVTASDRARVLRGLASVDAVTVFDEDAPTAVLERLRPHIFAKGGDYSDRRLPEESVLDRWGGQVVVLPYLSGRSTTTLFERAITTV
jgi:D-beta-D-heptose 7-phosphate kinase/D-beta-D-heptose 1-phosphate adenosyltransferase